MAASTAMPSRASLRSTRATNLQTNNPHHRNPFQTMNEHTRLDAAPIPFIDVAAQRRRLGRAIDDAVARVLAHCQFIQGPEGRTLEADLAAFCGAPHVIACSSG